MTVFAELDDSQRLYRLKHWLRDGGLILLFDKMFWSGLIFVVSFVLTGFMVFYIAKTYTKPAPVRPVPHVIDRHATAPMRDTHLRFNLQTKESNK